MTAATYVSLTEKASVLPRAIGSPIRSMIMEELALLNPNHPGIECWRQCLPWLHLARSIARLSNSDSLCGAIAPFPMITSRQNPLIKTVRQLRQPKGRREQGRLLLEGTNLITAAIAQGHNFDTFLYTAIWQQRHLDLWGAVAARSAQVVAAAPEVLAAVATTVNPDGAIATLPLDAITATPPANLRLGVMVERLQDPGNLGTLIRTAAATQTDALWLSAESVDVANPKVLRASAGAWFTVPLLTVPDLVPVIRDYQQQGVQVVATTPHTARPYWDLDWTKPSLIVLGNESAGLSADILTQADVQVAIPQAVQVESLNIAISGALLLYEVQRQYWVKA